MDVSNIHLKLLTSMHNFTWNCIGNSLVLLLRPTLHTLLQSFQIHRY